MQKSLDFGTESTEDEREKIRQSILEKLAPRSRVISPIAD